MSNPPPLYQVLQEKSVSVGKGMMGTSHVYDLKGKKSDQPGTEISINPEDLELDPAAIAAKYQHRSQSGKEKEDMRFVYMTGHLVTESDQWFDRRWQPEITILIQRYDGRALE